MPSPLPPPGAVLRRSPATTFGILKMTSGRAGIALLLMLTGCGGIDGLSNPTATPAPIPQLAAPAILQVENSDAGRPQSGLGSANLVYEYVAEGGIGRFSLIFFGPPPAEQQVGPVRSVRTVTVQLAQIYQGYIAYSGASSYISGLLQSESVPAYDETGAQGNLFRIRSRYAPHNLYSDGRHIANISAMAALPSVSYHLWTRSTPAGAAGVPIHSFVAMVSDAEQPMFRWHPELGGFTRAEATGPVRDPSTGAAVVIPTVVVQQVAVTTDSNVIDVDGHVGVDHGVTGSGPAQIFTGGREYTATWTQPAHGPPQFALADGSPAPMAAGEVWICLVPTGQPAVAS